MRSLSSAAIDDDEVLHYFLSNGTSSFYLRPNFECLSTAKNNTVQSDDSTREETRPSSILAIQFGSFGEKNVDSTPGNNTKNILQHNSESSLQLFESSQTDLQLHTATTKATSSVADHEILEMGEMVEKDFNEDGSLLVQSQVILLICLPFLEVIYI